MTVFFLPLLPCGVLGNPDGIVFITEYVGSKARKLYIATTFKIAC
jgi:hypothetical protein